jgi:hypothetical protein
MDAKILSHHSPEMTEKNKNLPAIIMGTLTDTRVGFESAYPPSHYSSGLNKRGHCERVKRSMSAIILLSSVPVLPYCILYINFCVGVVNYFIH